MPDTYISTLARWPDLQRMVLYVYAHQKHKLAAPPRPRKHLSRGMFSIRRVNSAAPFGTEASLKLDSCERAVKQLNQLQMIFFFFGNRCKAFARVVDMACRGLLTQRRRN